MVFGKMLSQRESKISRSQPTTVPPDSLQGLQTKTISEIESTDIALMNLLCAQGLPGAEGINISQCLELLDKWADRVGSETKRHWLRYEQNPAQFQHSRGVFQMIM